MCIRDRVESPDAIEPATKDAHTVMRYSENNLSAGVAYQGDYKTVVLGFPLDVYKRQIITSSMPKPCTTS